MAARMNKKKLFGAEKELDSARSKLEDVLAHISKGDSLDEDEDDSSPDSSPQLKRRRSRAKDKKLKCKDDGFVRPSSFVLKLFERSVDLAQFSYNSTNEDFPLYPVCRSWFRNNTELHKQYEPPPLFEDVDDLDISGNEDKPSGIIHLPKPKEKPRDKIGSEIDLRIPKSVRDYKKSPSQVDLQINSLVDESFTTLINKNLARWKEVRQDWKEAAMENENRYKHSCDVLKAMYERATGVGHGEAADQMAKCANDTG